MNKWGRVLKTRFLNLLITAAALAALVLASGAEDKFI